MIFIYSLLKKILKACVINLMLRKDILIVILNNLNYYLILNILKFSILFKFETLSDLTAIHYPDNFYEFELNYILLSYKLNLRVWAKIYFKKEALVISLNKLYNMRYNNIYIR